MSFIEGQIFCIVEQELNNLIEMVQLAAAGVSVQPKRIEASAEPRHGVAVLPLHGYLSQRPNIFQMLFGGTSLQGFRNSFRQAIGDPSVDAIVIHTDSPGGSAIGTEELANEIYAGRKEKRIVSFSDGLAASAAYWISASAHEVVASPSSLIGSVGVLGSHVDISAALKTAGVKVSYVHAGAHKIEQAPELPLSDDARAHMQTIVDSYYNEFIGSLARARNVSRARVVTDFGGGRVVTARQALERGMVDRIEPDIGAVIESLQPRRAQIRAAGKLRLVANGDDDRFDDDDDNSSDPNFRIQKLRYQ